MEAHWCKSKCCHGYQVTVNNKSETIDLSNYVDNGDWKLIGVKVRITKGCLNINFKKVSINDKRLVSLTCSTK